MSYKLKRNHGKPEYVVYNCPSCGTELKADCSECGQSFPCPTCQTPSTIPGKDKVDEWQAQQRRAEELERLAQQRQEQQQQEQLRQEQERQALLEEAAARVVETPTPVSPPATLAYQSPSPAPSTTAIGYPHPRDVGRAASRLINLDIILSVIGWLHIAAAVGVVLIAIVGAATSNNSSVAALGGVLSVIWAVGLVLVGLVFLGLGAVFAMLAYIGQAVTIPK